MAIVTAAKATKAEGHMVGRPTLTAQEGEEVLNKLFDTATVAAAAGAAAPGGCNRATESASSRRFPLFWCAVPRDPARETFRPAPELRVVM